MRKYLAAIFLLIFIFAVASCDTSAKGPAASTATPASAYSAGLLTIPRAAEGEFASPESAIQCFVDNLKKNDFIASTKAFAIYALPEHFNFKAYSEWLKINYIPTGLLPEAYAGLNEATVLSRAESCFKSALICLCGMDPTIQQPQKTAKDTADFVNAVSPAKLAGVTLAAADVEETLTSAMKGKHRDKMAAQAKAYGADECRAYVVDLTANGNKAECGAFIMLRYGDNWYCLGGIFSIPSK